MNSIIMRRIAIVAGLVLVVGVSTSCTEDDTTSPKDISGEVENFQRDIDTLLSQIDEAQTIESVSDGVLSD